MELDSAFSGPNILHDSTTNIRIITITTPSGILDLTGWSNFTGLVYRTVGGTFLTTPTITISGAPTNGQLQWLITEAQASTIADSGIAPGTAIATFVHDIFGDVDLGLGLGTTRHHLGRTEAGQIQRSV